MSIESPTKHNSVMALKGSMYTLTAIQLLENDLDELSYQLDEKIKQAPNFFQYAPLILDFQNLSKSTDPVDFVALIELLKNKKLIPIGIRGVSGALKETAIAAGLAVFPEDKTSSKKSSPVERPTQIELKETVDEPAIVKQLPLQGMGTRVITQPIRSGQQIYVPGGDLIILSSVSHGAEILADGHIHVYGSLRGRALAGVMGNTDAMIFCKSLEAELVSIAGQYRLSEDLKNLGWKQSVSIQLKEGRLNILPV